MEALQASIKRLTDLHKSGVLTSDDLESRKAALLDAFMNVEANTEQYGSLVEDDTADVPLGDAEGDGGNGSSGSGGHGGGHGYGFGSYDFGYGPYGPFGSFGYGFGCFGGWGWGWGYGKGYGKGKGFGRYHPYQTGPTSSIKIQPVPESITVEQLTETFSPYGEVISAVIMPGDPMYAYVNFTDPKTAEAAIALDHIEIEGVSCFIIPGKRRAMPRIEGSPTDGIGLFNLPYHTAQEDLDNLLNNYPGFKHVKMIMRPTGEFRGYAFAYFDSIENATFAKDHLTGLQLEGQSIDVKFSNMSAEESNRRAAEQVYIDVDALDQDVEEQEQTEQQGIEPIEQEGAEHTEQEEAEQVEHEGAEQEPAAPIEGVNEKQPSSTVTEEEDTTAITTSPQEEDEVPTE